MGFCQKHLLCAGKPAIIAHIWVKSPVAQMLTFRQYLIFVQMIANAAKKSIVHLQFVYHKI